MLDNGLDPLRFPEEHTVHCLVDVDICRASGFVVLIDPAEGEELLYTVGYALDGDGTNRLTQLAREIGARCSTCLGTGSLVKGMRAGIVGTIVDANMDPPLIQVESAEYVSPDVSFCTAQVTLNPTTTLALNTSSTSEPTVPTIVPTLVPTNSPTHNFKPTKGDAQTTNVPTLAPTTTESIDMNDKALEPSDAPSTTGPTNNLTATPTMLAMSDIPSASPTMTDTLLLEGDEVCHVG